MYYATRPSQQLGGFLPNLFKTGALESMFTRMFKFTPQSFSISNLTESFINITPFGIAMGQVAPDLMKKTIIPALQTAAPWVLAAVGVFTGGALTGYVLIQKFADYSTRMMLTKAPPIHPTGILMTFINSLVPDVQQRVLETLDAEKMELIETGQLNPNSLLVEILKKQGKYPTTEPASVSMASSIPVTDTPLLPLPPTPVEANLIMHTDVPVPTVEPPATVFAPFPVLIGVGVSAFILFRVMKAR